MIVAVAFLVVDELAKDKGPDSVAASTVSGDINELFGQLKVGKESPMTGYDRDKFPHWDTNKPGHGFGDKFAQYSKCTTREVVLLRDATGPVTLDPKSCKFTLGTDGGWRDQYGVLDRKSGELKPYKWVTNPTSLDIDHIVPLAEVWRSGAAKLSQDTRRDIANDAVNLVVSDPSANRSKGDQDPADYLPPGGFRCAYIDRYVRIKVKYNLTVDPDEQAALRTAIDGCAHA
ncbi:HNH endonuclease family protein [Nocardia callitridis]|uniref:HNH endonuclease family protein n=1 Tax=Nocardia callitridis TaxID=648753 RepID=A0ABP9KUM3_9NOCA